MKKSFCIALITCSSLLLIPTACKQSQTTNHMQSAVAAEKVSTESIQQTASAITVKVMVRKYNDNLDEANSSSGSGVLIAQSGNIYTVVTNAHVIGDDKYSSYTIKTFDGKTHDAILKNIKSNKSGQQDLALLQFEATEKYTPASLGDNKQVTPNQAVFTSGFADGEYELTFNSGKIGQISKKPLIGGYQIGFTNSTKQGMSGGALLNEEGKVIGVLGLGAAAILDGAYLYADGSRPDAQMLEKLRENSFAVPIASLTARNDLSTTLATTKPNQSTKYQGMVGKIDSIAEKISVKINSKNNGNGSGVIIAQDEDTYYVVTAGHVVTNEDDYTIVAPDGQSYPIAKATIKTFKGADLAIVQFTSQESYSTATIANYINNPDFYALSEENFIFVSGFPGNQRERNLTIGRIRETGNWAAELAKDSFSLTNGNGLLYTNLSLPGMSGGAVLDSQGRLIGINTGAENEYVEEKAGQYVEVGLGYSLGIPSKKLLNLAKLTDIPSTALKEENSLPLKLTNLEINSIKGQLFNLKAPGKNATETDWLNYGNQLWRNFEDEKAVAAFDRAITLNPQEYRAYYGKALALNNRQAIDALKQVTKLAPNFAAAWHNLAFTLSGYYGRSSEALPAYNRAIQLEPKVFTNYVRRGEILQRLKRYQEAIASYNQSIELQPTSEAYENRGDINLELEKYQSAIADYNRAKKLDLGVTDVYTENKIGIAYNGLDDYQSAIAILSQAIKESDSPQSSTNSKLYGNRGYAYSQLKNYQAALADYNQAIALSSPLSPNEIGENYLSRSLLYYKLKDVPKGDRDLETGIRLLKQELTLTDEPKLRHIAKIFKDAGKPEAERKIQRLISYLKASNPTIQGSELAESKKHREAIKLYTKAIALDPQFQLALKYLNQAIEVDPKYDDAYDYRGVVYTKLKDYQKALSDFNQAISLNPKFAKAYLDRGKIHYRLNNRQKAKNNWRKAAELYSVSIFEQEDLEVKLKKLEQEAQQARQENDLESYQTNKAALDQFQVVYYMEQGKNLLYDSETRLSKQKAVEFFTKAIEIEPRHFRAYVSRGSAYKDLKNYPKAIADWEKVIELNQDPGHYWDLAGLYIDLEDYKSALSTYTKAIAVYPDSDLYDWRADLYLFRLKDYPKAIADYTKAIENNPELADSYFGRGKGYFSLKNYKLAIADFTKAIKIFPKYRDAYYNRGITYTFLNDYPAAINDLTKAIEICNKDEYDTQRCTEDQPTYAQLYFDRGMTYFSLKQYSQALADFNKVVLILPKNADVYFQRGMTYFSLEQYPKALADFNKVISFEPKNADAYTLRGKVYYFLQDNQQAQENWQTAAKLYKQQGKLQLTLKDLRKNEQQYQQQGKVEDYKRIKQVIEVFKQFQ